MPTTITTPSNDLVKMRWTEPYVSDGLNKKLNGIVPPGILRGGTLVTAASGLNVRIDADPDTGDSVYSYIDADGRQLTFRQEGNVTLDLATVASSTIYVCLYVEYTISNATIVEWRTYSETELITSPVSEAAYLVVIGRVVVPGSGPIAGSAITPAQRREAGLSPSAALREWEQVIVNGIFESAPPSPVGGFAVDRIPGWFGAFNAAGYTIHISTASPLFGTNELEIRSDGSVPMVNDDTIQSKVIPVSAGSLVKARVSVRGDGMPVGGAASAYGLLIRFYDATLSPLSFVSVGGDNSLSGTFAYTTFEEIIEAPAGALWMRVGIEADTDGVTPGSGDAVFFDDIRVWVRRQTFSSDLLRADAGLMGGDLAGTRTLLAPAITGLVVSMDDFVNQTHEQVNVADVPSAGGTYQFLAELMRGTANAGTFYKQVLGGFREAAKTQDRITDREIADTRYNSFGASGEKDLIAAVNFDDLSTHDDVGEIRFYQANEIQGFVEPSGFMITINARYDQTTALWNRDTADASWALVLNREGIKAWCKDTPGNATPWADGAWDTNSNNPIFEVLLSPATTQLNVRGNAGTALISIPGATAENVAETAGAFPSIALRDQTVVKATGFITVDASGAFGTVDGYNWTAIRTGNVIDVSFVDALDNANLILAGALLGGQSEFLSFSSLAASGFTITVFDDTGGTVALSSSNARTFSFICHGELRQ
jgi:hypothetical protein